MCGGEEGAVSAGQRAAALRLLGHELIQQVDGFDDLHAGQRVVDVRARAAGSDDAPVPQDREVLAGVGLRDPECGNQLPDGAGNPTVQKFNPNDQPILSVALSAPGQDLMAVQSYAENTLQPAIERVEADVPPPTSMLMPPPWLTHCKA